MKRFPFIPIILSLVVSATAWGQSSVQCQQEEVAINLFQIHHTLDESETCILVKAKAEPNFMALNIPSHRTHLESDSTAWTPFDEYEFCIEEGNPEKLQRLGEDLRDGDFLRRRRRNYNYQHSMIRYFMTEVTIALNMNFDIKQNGVFFYGLFNEQQCVEENSGEIVERRYPVESLNRHEELMNHYYQLMQIFAEHFDVIESHSFLPPVLDDLN